jgi:hypothetical protein
MNTRRNLPKIFLLCAVMLPAVAQAQFDYTINPDGTITISRYFGSEGAVTVPPMIDGYLVTGIGEGAFYDETNLTSVTVPDGVKSIGDSAFTFCNNLQTVTLGYNLANIGNSAFWGCNSLTSVALQRNVITIGDNAFSECISLGAINVDPLNSAFKSVGGILFNRSQTQLIQYPPAKADSGYIIPDSVTNIAGYAFYECAALTNVTIGPNLTGIGEGAFGGCYNLSSLVIPDAVTSIGNYAFLDCTSLRDIHLPNNLTSIGVQWFGACFSLTTITIPSGVTHLGFFTFVYCPSLTGVYFLGDAPSYDAYIFYATTNAIVYYLPGKTNWDTTFGGQPTMLWNPQLQNASLQTNQFGFIISGTTNIPVVVEASTGLAGASWTALQSCTLTNGSIYFNDPQWTTYPSRFYRIRSP